MRILIVLLSFFVAIVGLVFQLNTQDIVQVNIFSVSPENMDRFGYICSALMIVASFLYLFGKQNRYFRLIAVMIWGILAFVGFFAEPGYNSILFIRPVTCAICIILALFIFIPSFKDGESKS
ncbi:hypothetical protein [Listeria fleischmannii]|jgi:hypothetical protein|uniref:Uncharacterized protein n=1 Tax=Listeria fleischmannii FSL S10-1203 TaxID=1265822 RepID=W7DKG3_9LIST|nr:hypothetical protein [Listeria fleischmannii]EUJ52414.1 hypothetical protein MCOL2_14021 [Listeria fleischmannii FSL S10-1203]